MAAATSSANGTSRENSRVFQEGGVAVVHTGADVRAVWFLVEECQGGAYWPCPFEWARCPGPRQSNRRVSTTGEPCPCGSLSRERAGERLLARSRLVRHASTLEHNRSAHDIKSRQGESQVSTEELREAVAYYRSLFEDLLDSAITTR
jgi:hypothetical protein